jgi:hypothetical protein
MFNAVLGNGSATVTQTFRDVVNTTKSNLTVMGSDSKISTTPSLNEDLVLYSTLFNTNPKETPLLPGLSVYDVVDSSIQYDRPNLLKYVDYNQIKYCGVLTMFNPSYKPVKGVQLVRHYDKIHRWVPSFDKFSQIKNQDITGSFYLNTLDYQMLNKLNLNPELQLSTLNVTNQNNIAKILR